MSRHSLVSGIVVFTLAVCAACASSSSSDPGERTRRETSVLTRDEIAESQVSNLFDAVEQLRPRWLQVRAPRSLTAQTSIVVFTGRTFLGGPETLRQLDTKSVVRLRYLDAAQANATLPVPAGQHVEGAIVVELVAGGR